MGVKDDSTPVILSKHQKTLHVSISPESDYGCAQPRSGRFGLVRSPATTAPSIPFATDALVCLVGWRPAGGCLNSQPVLNTFLFPKIT